VWLPLLSSRFIIIRRYVSIFHHLRLCCRSVSLLLKLSVHELFGIEDHIDDAGQRVLPLPLQVLLNRLSNFGEQRSARAHQLEHLDRLQVNLQNLLCRLHDQQQLALDLQDGLLNKVVLLVGYLQR